MLLWHRTRGKEVRRPVPGGREHLGLQYLSAAACVAAAAAAAGGNVSERQCYAVLDTTHVLSVECHNNVISRPRKDPSCIRLLRLPSGI